VINAGSPCQMIGLSAFRGNGALCDKAFLPDNRGMVLSGLGSQWYHRPGGSSEALRVRVLNG
jgi:hypothetical protein